MNKIVHLLFLMILFANLISAQNVGIGTKLPDEKLHVDSGNIKIGKVIWGSATNNSFLKFGDGEFVGIGETTTDDWMELHARKFNFVRSAGTVSPFVEINGNIKIIDGSQGTGKILTSDATGTASWQPVLSPAASAAFKARKSFDQLTYSGGSYSMNFGTVDYNDGGNYSSDAFITPTTGVYHFDIKLLWALTAVGSRYNVTVTLNSGTFANELSRSQYFIEPSTSGNFSSDLSVDIKLTGGQQVYVMAFQSSGTTQSVLSNYSTFNGHRLY